MVLGGCEVVVSTVELDSVEEPVTVIVVEKEVVKLVEAVPIVVTTTELLMDVLVSVDMMTRGYRKFVRTGGRTRRNPDASHHGLKL